VSTPIGSRALTPFTYTQHIDTGSELYFPDEGLEASYRGFKFAKESGYQLYYILCPEGKLLPGELSGRYSKIVLLQDAVDKWLNRNQLPAAATLPDVPPPPPPKKSHHKRPEPQTDEAVPPEHMSDSTRALMEARDLNSSQE